MVSQGNSLIYTFKLAVASQGHGMGHSSRTPPYSPGAPIGTPPQMHQGQSVSPSRMDTSYNINRPLGQSPPPAQHTSSLQFGLSDQELIEHAARTTDRLMNNELRSPSLYNSLMQAHDPQLAQAG